MKPEKNHLVGGFNPLKNSQLGLLFPTEWKKIMFQTTKQSWFLFFSGCNVAGFQSFNCPSDQVFLAPIKAATFNSQLVTEKWPSNSYRKQWKV